MNGSTLGAYDTIRQKAEAARYEHEAARYEHEVARQNDVPHDTPFHAIQRTGEGLAQLVQRIEMLADKLAGPTPPETSPAGGIKGASGLMEALRQAAEGGAEMVQRGHDALSRIDRFLP